MVRASVVGDIGGKPGGGEAQAPNHEVGGTMHFDPKSYSSQSSGSR